MPPMGALWVYTDGEGDYLMYGSVEDACRIQGSSVHNHVGTIGQVQPSMHGHFLHSSHPWGETKRPLNGGHKGGSVCTVFLVPVGKGIYGVDS